VNRPSAGENPAAGGLGRRFAAGDPVLGQRADTLTLGGAGEHRGGLNLARGSREGADRGEVAELRDGSHRQWASGGDWGRGVVSQVRGGVAKLISLSNFSLNHQGGGKRGGRAYRRGRRRRRLHDCSGEGGEGWLWPVRGEEVLGATLL
jgi:hypothetical protein